MCCRRLRTVCFALTSSCTLTCPMCHGPGSLPDADEAHGREVVRALARLGFEKVHFTGGEPLLLPAFEALVREAHDCGLRTEVSTNGELLSDTLLDKLRESTDAICVPVDGADDATHAMHRGRPGHFGVVMNRVSQIQARGIRCHVGTVLTRQNVAQLSDIGRMVRAWGVARWKVFEYYPMTNAVAWGGMSGFRVTKHEADSVIQELQAQFERGWLAIRRADAGSTESYIFIDGSGTMRIPRRGKYEQVGSILSMVDGVRVLEDAGFKFDEYEKRLHFSWRSRFPQK